MKFATIVCLCGGALAAVGCADGPGAPTSPSATSASRPGVAALAAAPRSGELHVTKECSENTGLANSFCTITSSNVKAIEVGTKVVYLQASGATELDSDIVLDTPGPGNNQAFGHCHLVYATLSGVCTLSGGTGIFTHFTATAQVTPFSLQDLVNWHWDGAYSLDPQD
jgi:hypothetical protein